MRMIINTAVLMLLFISPGYGQSPSMDSTGEKVVTFRFVPGEDMFYIPWGGNDAELKRLYALVDEYRAEIASGRIPLYVDGYCASLPVAKENLNTAFIRANRVKTELILHKGLQEEHFVTSNQTTSYEGMRDVVVVTLHLPAAPEPPGQPEPVVKEPERETEVAPEPKRETEQEMPHASVIPTVPAYSSWSLGVNIGIPFFRGDFTSFSDDKTYIGMMAGVQATYRISRLFGVTLSFDWAQNKAGSRDYAANYLLDAGGMTWYTPQTAATQAYKNLYSKINMFNIGLHLDMNVNRLFGPGIADARFKVIVSPAVYAQHFSSKVYTKNDGKVYVGDRLSKDVSFGVGGDLVLRYVLNPAIDLQLKGTGIWITDNGFDNIKTVGHVKQNAVWSISAGVIWNIGTNKNDNSK